jgi:hypothetical protein
MINYRIQRTLALLIFNYLWLTPKLLLWDLPRYRTIVSCGQLNKFLIFIAQL